MLPSRVKVSAWNAQVMLLSNQFHAKNQQGFRIATPPLFAAIATVRE